MKSIRIMNSYKVLNLSRIEVGATFLRVRGDDFSSTKFAIVDGQITTEFAISGNTLFIYPPSTIAPADVRFVSVVGESRTVDNNTLLSLGIGYDVRETSGVDRLIQLFVFLLLSAPGTYILDMSSGGGVLAIMQRGGGTDPSRLLPELVSAVRKTESDIRAMQSGLRLSADEMLVAASVINTSINSADLSITMFVELTTLSGAKRAFNIGI